MSAGIVTGAGALAAVRKLRPLFYYPSGNGWENSWINYNGAQLTADLALMQQQLHVDTVEMPLHAKAGAFDFPTPTVGELANLTDALTRAKNLGINVLLRLFDLVATSNYTSGVGINNGKAWADALLTALPAGHTVKALQISNEPTGLETGYNNWIQAVLPHVQQTWGLPCGIGVKLSTVDATHDGLDNLRNIITALGGVASVDFWDMHFYLSHKFAYSVFSGFEAVMGSTPFVFGEGGQSTNAGTLGGTQGNLPGGVPSTQTALEAYQEYWFRAVNYAARKMALLAFGHWMLYDFTTSPSGIPSGNTASFSSSGSYDAYYYGVARTDGSFKPAGTTLQTINATGLIDPSFNAGFEQQVWQDSAGTVPWPAQWIQSNSSAGAFALDTTAANAHSGNNSVTIQNPTNSTAGGAPSWKLVPIVSIDYLDTTRTFTATVWARGINLPSGAKAGLILEWHDRGGNTISSSSVYLTSGTADTGWVQLSRAMTPPAGAAYAQIVLVYDQNGAGASGLCRWDDVTFG